MKRNVTVQLDEAHFTADTTAQLGDSGAPIIDKATGRAVGMVSDFGTDDMPPTTDDGPSVLRILSDTAAHGFALTLVTAAYVPPA